MTKHTNGRNKMRAVRPRSMARAWALACVLAVVLSGWSSARAGEIEDLNRDYARVPAGLRSDMVLIPLLAKMDPPPKGVEAPDRAAMLPAGREGWSEAVAWAQAPAQRALLEALAKVTKEQEWGKAFVWAQPYGADATAVEIIATGLYTDLGDPAVLAGARHAYLAPLDSMSCLVQVEATRLMGEGKAGEALEVLTNWAYFARSMADRRFYAEVRWGLTQVWLALERMRDVMRQDLLAPKSVIKDTDLRKLLARLSETDARKAMMSVDRLVFPEGDLAAATQLASIVYGDSGSLDPSRFASTMSRVGSGEFPLRLFSEAGKWSGLAGSQANRAEATTKIAGVFSDWKRRWDMSPFDRRMSDPWEYTRLGNQHAVVKSSIPDMTPLFDLRMLVRVELAGTRTAAAILGTKLETGNWAPVQTAVRPRWLTKLEVDAFNPNRDYGAEPPLEYVPPRASPGPGQPAGFSLEVFGGSGENFEVRIIDEPLVYSVGSDLAFNRAQRIQNTTRRVEGADYLLWPPLISLVRQHRLDAGVIK